MLSESDCRVLVSAFDMLLADFDPRDAIIYLEGKGVLTEDLAEEIEAKTSRLDRLRALLRAYRRRASDLTPLIEYFEYSSGQSYIAEFLRDKSENVLDNPRSANTAKPPLSREQRMRKLLMSNVPAVRNHVRRETEMAEVAGLLRSRSRLESFFVVLHGIVGSGKTSLAAAVLAEEEDIVGGHYDCVCFVQDSRSSPDKTKYVFGDLLVTLRDSVDISVANPLRLEEMSSVALSRQIQDALIDRPNVLVVLDDVTQVDTVRWADQLGLRVLATTRNVDLFSAATSSCDVIKVGGVSQSEAEELMRRAGVAGGDGNLKANAAISAAFEVSSGNVGLLGKMLKMAGGKHARLSEYATRIRNQGLSTVCCISSYAHDNIHSVLSAQVTALEATDRDALACAAVMPTEEWIPLEVWCLLVPVDVCGFSDGHAEVREQLSRLCNRGCWLIESEDGDAFRMTSFVSAYLRETVDKATIKVLLNKLSTALNDDVTGGRLPPATATVIQEFLAANSKWFSKFNNLSD